MSFLSEVKTYIQLLGGTGVTGTIILGDTPAEPDAVCILYETGGAPPERAFGVVGVDTEMLGLQVVTRGAPGDYAGPRAKIELIYRHLMKVEAMTLSGTYYKMIRASQSPFFFNRDLSKNPPRVMFAVNFLCEKSLSV